ncbi:MAG: aminotransferase class I/II-fold pyridoxal phosphate-dependent enzyme [Clostridia bacterium]|nr:aminotransferase class I/II-fold pyridoxal phosphate-dependent enzyme [Clostridia bacterium]
MQEYHILKLLNGRNTEVSFHTPGHKQDYDYCLTFPTAKSDTTELPYTDDLSAPTGAIAAAQADIARIVGAKRSYITTDGSSSGVMAMVFVAAARGKKLIVPRTSHKSVWNACRILGVEPVIVQGEINGGVMAQPSAEQIERLICADESISGIIATSPDYYGNIAPLKDYYKVLKTHGRLLLVDGAHGGHLAYEKDRQGYAGVYADIWVDGVHKSMPALTQGALVHLNDLALCERLEEGLNIFRTTSPSFPIMASVEYSVKFCYANTERIAAVKNAACEARRRIQEYGFKLYPSADWTKLAIDISPFGQDARLVAKQLEKKGIYAEFTDGRYILFYLSPMTDSADLKRLMGALVKIVQDGDLRADGKREYTFPDTVESAGYLKALAAPYEYVPLGMAEGRVCAANAGVSPPCVPVVAAGEIITKNVIEILGGSSHIFGVKDGKIRVVSGEI